MRFIVSILLSAAVSATAFAQGTNCAATASEKKLTGNARAEFILQCEKAGKARMTLATKDTKKSGMVTAGKDDHCGHAASDM
jgi:hypothetical protein